MADTKISELVEKSVPASNDDFVLVDNSATPDTKRTTFNDIQTNLTLTASQVSDFDTEVSNNSSVTANTSKDTNVTTNLSEGTSTTTTVDVNSSDGTNATLVSASTSRAGLLTKAKFDEIVANTTKVTNATHIGDVSGATTLTIGADKVNDTHIDWGTGANQVSTADIPEETNLFYTEARVSANTDVAANTSARHAESHTVASHSDTTATGAELNTLTGGGDTTLHDHDGISENTSARHTQNTDTSLGSGAVAADHGTAATDQIVNVCYGTSETPPTASTTTEGALYVQYTA